jgi:propionyl-CoA synthetase
MNVQSSSRYAEVYARAMRDPEGFWAEAAREIDWIEPAKKVFDPSQGLYGRWFAGARVNTIRRWRTPSPSSPMPRCCTR